MVALSRCLGFLAVVAVVDGARRKRASKGQTSNTKFIQGVPVLNYQAAYAGAALTETGEREGEWIVTMKPEANDAQIQSLCQGARRGCKLQGHTFLETRGTESDLEKIIMSAPGMIQFIEPDLPVSIPEDELEGTPFEEDGPSAQAATWGLERIGASTRRSSGQNTYAYVLDTGVRTTHREFNGRAKSALETHEGRIRVCNGDRNCAGDRQGHGTHCAGTIAGSNYGAAPFGNIRAVKCLGDDGSGSTAGVIAAMDWIAYDAPSRDRPAVVSMSLGGGYSQAQNSAVDRLVSAGFTVVVAAGNDNSDACSKSPASAGTAITVGSTDSGNRRSWFSNYGSCVNIWAPGSDVVSLSQNSDTGLTSMSGTSMACPHVAGAILLALQNNPSWNYIKAWERIRDNGQRNQISDVKSGSPNLMLSLRNL